MGSGGDGRLPHTGMRNRAATGPAVAGGRGHENPGVRCVQKRYFGRVQETRGRTGDRVVNDVDAIGDGLINASNEIRCEATARAVGLVPEGFVHRYSSARSHSAEIEGG